MPTPTVIRNRFVTPSTMDPRRQGTLPWVCYIAWVPCYDQKIRDNASVKIKQVDIKLNKLCISSKNSEACTKWKSQPSLVYKALEYKVIVPTIVVIFFFSKCHKTGITPKHFLINKLTNIRYAVSIFYPKKIDPAFCACFWIHHLFLKFCIEFHFFW